MNNRFTITSDKDIQRNIVKSSPDRFAINLKISGATVFSLGNSYTEQRLLNIANTVGTVRQHPHSNEYGITCIREISDSQNIAVGQGFTSDELPLHTDGSVERRPPKYMLLACIENSETGGESTFSSIHDCAQSLRSTDPPAFGTLTDKAAITINSKSKPENFPIVCNSKDGMIIRYRTDVYMTVNENSKSGFMSLTELVEFNKITMKLRANECVILNNHHWAHGRNAFVGSRRMARVLID